MRKSLLVSILLVILISSYQVSTIVATEKTSRSDFSPLDTEWEFNLEVLPFHYDFIGGDIEPDTGIYGNLTVTSPVGGLVNLVMMDETNYDLYADGQTAQGYTVLYHATDESFTYIYPGTGVWYMVIINEGLDTKYVTLEFAQDETPPDIIVNLSNGTSYSGEFEISVTAEDERFDVEEIHLYIDGVEKLGRVDNTLIYSWDTTDFEAGSHNITITATDTLHKTRSVQYLVIVAQPSSLLLPVIGIGGAAVVIVIALVMFKKRQTS
ncbi:MAG: Ig-like domain-containing protein [Candidatus Thorarchaeota archaeon]